MKRVIIPKTYATKTDVLRAFKSRTLGKDYFKLIDEKYRDDQDIAWSAICANQSNFKAISERLKNDRDFLFAVLTKNTNSVNGRFPLKGILQYIPDDVKEDKAFFIRLMDKGLTCYKFVSPTLKEDKSLFVKNMSTIPNDWTSRTIQVQFNYAPDNIKNDLEVISQIYENSVYQYISLASHSSISHGMQIEGMRYRQRHPLSQKNAEKQIMDRIGIILDKITKNWSTELDENAVKEVANNLTLDGLRVIQGKWTHDMKISSLLNDVISYKAITELEQSKDVKIIKGNPSKKRRAFKP